MVTQRELIYEILEALRLYSDDQDPDKRLVARLIDVYRIQAIHQDKETKNDLSDYKTTLKNLQVEMYKNQDHPLMKNKEVIMRTVDPLPDLLSSLYIDGIIRVRNPRLIDETYEMLSYEKAKFFGNGVYNKKDTSCFLYNDYLYFKIGANPKIALLEFVTVDCILKEPAKKLDEKDPYPLKEEHWPYVKNAVLADLSASFRYQKDTINNAADN